MFRRGKTDDNTSDQQPDAAANNLNAPPLKPFSRRGSHGSQGGEASDNPTPPSRPGTDMASRRAAAAAGTRPRAGASEGNKLTVGRDINLKGEITSCDKLVVEGHVEAAHMEARMIEVAPTGVFKGDAHVDEADISGRFEGTLIARDRLTVRSKGRISGEVRYGTIVIESGGEISGAMKTLSSEDATATPEDTAPAGTSPATPDTPDSP